VTPVGTPDRERVMLFLKPPCAVVVIVVFTAPPPARRTTLGEVETVKLGLELVPVAPAWFASNKIRRNIT
jgi:hypothetical protein